MTWQQIRPVTLGAIERDEELLVEELTDPESDERFYRFLGGGVDFGEHSRDALHREFDEELGVELTDVSLVGTYERVFTFAGSDGHEIWRVYSADIVEDWPYEQERFEYHEPDLDEDVTATWLSKDRIRSGDVTFYTPEILDDL